MRVGLRLLVAGSCRHPECMVTGRFGTKMACFPALVGVISHPTRGAVLFDTGYGEALAHSRDPVASLYRTFMHYTLGPGEACVHQLAAMGIVPQDVHAIVLSHLHPDHAGGLADFPGVPVYLTRATLEGIAARPLHRRLGLGLLRDMFPADLSARAIVVEGLRSVPLSGAWKPFGEGADLFGDGSLTAIALPGHSEGQIGLKLEHDCGRPFFLAADAAWLARCYREMLKPLVPARLFISEYGTYLKTLRALLKLERSEPDLAIIPSHCSDTVEKYRDEFG